MILGVFSNLNGSKGVEAAPCGAAGQGRAHLCHLQFPCGLQTNTCGTWGGFGNQKVEDRHLALVWKDVSLIFGVGCVAGGICLHFRDFCLHLEFHVWGPHLEIHFVSILEIHVWGEMWVIMFFDLPHCISKNETGFCQIKTSLVSADVYEELQSPNVKYLSVGFMSKL